MRACAYALALLLTACGDDAGAPAAHADGSVPVNPGNECLDPLPRGPDACMLRIQPTFAAIHANILAPTCGAATTGASCHGPRGGMAGLFLHDRDEAYANLLAKRDGRARVVPGDPECSLLVYRVESDDPAVWMPPGPAMLDEKDRCAIITWIAMGAEP